MSKIHIHVVNHRCPVGDHAYITRDGLQLLDFLRIESTDGHLEVDTEQLARWNVVRGWRAAQDYEAALDELLSWGACRTSSLPRYAAAA